MSNWRLLMIESNQLLSFGAKGTSRNGGDLPSMGSAIQIVLQQSQAY